MKLVDACDIGEACGLQTVGEAVINIELHAHSLFAYSEMGAELAELYAEARTIQDKTPISAILKRGVIK